MDVRVIALILLIQAAGFIAAARIPSLHRGLKQIPKPLSGQVFLDGLLQSATLDPTCVGVRCGGKLVVNGETVTIPKNLIVMFPANALMWAEIFSLNPLKSATGCSPAYTGLALNDPLECKRHPTATYSVSVTANRLNSTGEIVAALVDLSQLSILEGAGFIDAIDYTIGELSVEVKAGTQFSKIRINDPTGRFGLANNVASKLGGFDERFCVDPENPTIISATGFPMCIPRENPSIATDPTCPKTNRPLNPDRTFSTSFMMDLPPTITTTTSNQPLNPLVPAPFEIGDYITFSGVLAKDSLNNEFIAAYAIENNVAIYTQPGSDPAYMAFEAALIGTGGLNVLGAGEASVRTRFEGFTTDWSRPVQIWGLDFAQDGSYTTRDWGTVMPDPGAASGLGAVQGRWRVRPPCVVPAPLFVGSSYLGNKGCTAPAAGIYVPPTREVMAQMRDNAPNTTVGWCTPTTVPNWNIVAGGTIDIGCIYRNPAIEYIWPENVPGSPIVENNFNSVPFLVNGGYKSGAGTIAQPLNPWPSNINPVSVCNTVPTITYPMTTRTVFSGAFLTLDVTVTGAGIYQVLWSQVSGPTADCAPTCQMGSPTFGPITGTSTFTVTITNSCGVSYDAPGVVTVNLATIPTQMINPIPPQSVSAGEVVTISASLQDPAASAFFTWQSTVTSPASTSISTNPGSTALGTAVTIVQAANTAASSSSITFKAPNLSKTINPLYLVWDVYTTSNRLFTSTTAPVAKSDVMSVIIMVNPPPDNLLLTAVLLRCDKHRLSITATSDVNDPLLKVWLLPYTTNDGKLYDASTTYGNRLTYSLVNNVATFTLVIEAVPLPRIGSLVSITSELKGSDGHLMAWTDVKGTCTI